MEKFGDPEFLSHATAARLYTLIAMRAAAADVVPFRFVPYGRALREHIDELRLIHARRARQADPAPPEAPGDFAGLGSLVRATQEFQAAARDLDEATEAVLGRDRLDHARLSALNDAIARVERAFLLDQGLPGRPWFKHAIYAPGLTTGYAAWPLPAIRQAIEDKNAAALADAIAAAAQRIQKASAALRAASERARSAMPAR
jgi:N-acetylated-alpha-linked acidic dipeptidase